MVSDPTNDKNIWLSASEGDMERVAYLVEKCGLDVNTLDENSYSTLHAATSYSHSDLLRYLIEKGGNVNIVDDDHETPLFVAEDEDVARLLVEHGADASHRNAEGLTPLEKLIQDDEHEEVQEYLKSVGPAPVSMPNTNDNTALEDTETGREIAEIMEQAQRDGTDPDERLRELVTRNLMGQQQ
ncbi:hypothetical protein E3P92_03594 [Wallemia ichthyophaga]|uniref:Uncharacterized protein n=1 Tax=Wallemia ichthyophaga TaxID=245174 RepID=A0A4T0IHF9_WALIC|nr:hypothetical protein E3P91_01302 [Wallemia ichthyophaga]TIA83307.1 hypothetical protein E3P98_00821 [Wallemia ichthyophaga]TIA92275.1 hypothetical protein E3P97_01611 [Wallemia ichthyophaga]TIA95806.1 hypothetical protein E3P95_03532 [Wallemia ichthyophaga]TIA96834.1 hypothetical protein E3P94_03539 [Wallemia ichthyophaga]